MEGEHDVAALEVLLGVQVQRVAHRPPPATAAVDVPDVVDDRADSLNSNLLQVHHRVIVELGLEVGKDRVALARRGLHRRVCLSLSLLIRAVCGTRGERWADASRQPTLSGTSAAGRATSPSRP